MKTQSRSRHRVPLDTPVPTHGSAVVGDAPPAQGALLRIAAVAIPVGLALQILMEVLHPSETDPNDSAAAFQEYATSGTWTAVHIGQFFAALLIALGLMALARFLSRQGGIAGALAVVGGVAAVVVAAIFAVQMAVDGVALKATIDAWISATDAADKTAAFHTAEGVRWVEKGLSGFFHLVNGTAFLALGLSIALGRSFPRWLGWAGTAAGIGFLAGGVTAAHTGFSPEAGTVLLAPLVLGIVFLFGASVCMWRRSAIAR
jgi:hypothetical protein